MAARGSRAIDRRPGRLAPAGLPLLGPAASILLGLAGGFFCLAVPSTAIARLVDPAWFGGHVPLALLVALAVGGVTWRGFALLDRAAGRPLLLAPPMAADEADAPAPAPAPAPVPPVRRADAHPDAPPRRPIFAGSDLGPPLDPPFAPAAPLPAAPATSRAEAAGPIDPPAARTTAPVPSGQPLPAIIDDLADGIPSLAGLMRRLEAGLARKALIHGGGDADVTPLHREIRPAGGDLVAMVDRLRRQTAARR